MSAPEPTTVAPVEEVKPTDAVETMVEDPPAVTEVVDPVEASPVIDAEPPATVPPKEELKPDAKEAKEAASKNFFGKMFETVKARVIKSPKKNLQKLPETPAADAAAKEEVPDAPAVIDPKDVTVVTEPPPQQTESAAPVSAAAPVPAAVPDEAEEKPPAKEEKPASKELKAVKVGRRLSTRVGDFFKPKSKSEVTTPPKVAENPPKIDEPKPVAPLENPASEAAKVEDESNKPEVMDPVTPAIVTTA
jgi:hypothetical protein